MDDGDEVTLGPISYLVVEFPQARLTGEGMQELIRLTERGIIRVLDLVFVMKDADGIVTAVEITDLDGDGELDLAVFEGASSDLLGADDLDEAGGAIAAEQRCRRPALREHLGRSPGRAHCAAAGPSSWRAATSPSGTSPKLSISQRQPADTRRRSARPEGNSTMPGLIRGVARTAVDRRNRDRSLQPGVETAGRPVGRQESTEPEPTMEAPPPEAAADPDPIQLLTDLGRLHEAGTLTDEEFAAQKARILGQM